MKYRIVNNSNLDMSQMKPLLSSFLPFARQKMGFSKPVCIKFVHDDQNAADPLGKTAFYDPNDYSVTLYTAGRHPKDIMRSLSHELVHHRQNCDGKFDQKPTYGEDYFQNDEDLREIEREAYEEGNMCFRLWEELYRAQLQESFYYKTGEIKMKLNEWKSKELFERLTEAYGYGKVEEEIDEAHCMGEGDLDESHCMEGELEEGKDSKMPDKNKDGIPDYAQDGKGKGDQGKAKESGDSDKGSKEDKDSSKVPPQFRKHVEKKKGLSESQIRLLVREAFKKAFVKEN
jgi:hypothetical protein